MLFPGSFPPNNARDWSSILRHYSELETTWSIAMTDLLRKLHEEGFVKAGLYGSTSMFELKLGLSHDVLNNPHLRISPHQNHFQLTYEDGSDPAWTINVPVESLYERVERFLIKRARWFGRVPGKFQQ